MKRMHLVLAAVAIAAGVLIVWQLRTRDLTPRGSGPVPSTLAQPNGAATAPALLGAPDVPPRAAPPTEKEREVARLMAEVPTEAPPVDEGYAPLEVTATPVTQASGSVQNLLAPDPKTETDLEQRYRGQSAEAFRASISSLQELLVANKQGVVSGKGEILTGKQATAIQDEINWLLSHMPR